MMDGPYKKLPSGKIVDTRNTEARVVARNTSQMTAALERHDAK